MPITEKKDLVPVLDAAQELGTTGLSVMMRIKWGGLAGREIEGKWYVTSESLEQYRREGADRAGSALCVRNCSSKSGCGSCA